MKKFSRSLSGYNVDEVNDFIDDIISKVENIIKEEDSIKKELLFKDSKIKELESTVEYYKLLEKKLNSSLLMAEESKDYIKKVAKSERDDIINEARENANRIVNDALLRAEKVEYNAQLLRKNINLFKNRVRTILNQQLDLVDDLDQEKL